MQRSEAVLFDMDGVLLDSREAWFRVLEEAGQRFRGRPVTREEFDPTFGQGTAADVRAFALGCTPEELDRFYVEHFGRYASHVWVDPQTRPVLEELSRRGAKLAVVTNTVSPLAKVLLERAGVLGLFQVVACADQVPRAKPSPDLVLLALERLGVPAGAAWYVGDSRYDREAAAAANVRFVGLGIDGDARVESLGELLRLG